MPEALHITIQKARLCLGCSGCGLEVEQKCPVYKDTERINMVSYPTGDGTNDYGVITCDRRIPSKKVIFAWEARNIIEGK